jgi:hypothetical protein
MLALTVACIAIVATRVRRGRCKHWLREYRQSHRPARARGRKLAAIKSKKLQPRAAKKFNRNNWRD